METILVVDDEPSVRESFRMILGRYYHLLAVGNGLDALECLDRRHVDLVLLDLTMPGMSGLELLDAIEQRGDSAAIIVVTASNSVAAAVQAMKHGARDYVTKPFDVDELRRLVERTLTDIRERRELLALREQGAIDLEHVVGGAPAWRACLAKARQAMKADSTVLLTGETGTGKDVLAQAIHRGSPRKDRAFVPLSCCAIPPHLVESELFGLVKGAFTGATEARTGKMQIADRGSLFLDEIGEMPMEAQAKLLRVLQDGCFFPVGGSKLISVDVRFICATNRSFERAIATGRFREDLYYRINVLPIAVPPLRHRREDIPELVAHFVGKHAGRVNAKVREIAPRAMARLMAYHWPGNVRELENTIERVLVCHSEERVILPEFLDEAVPKPLAEPLSDIDYLEGLPLDVATQRVETHLIRRALERCNFVQSHTAEMLGTTRRILKYKMDQLEIEPPSNRPSAH